MTSELLIYKPDPQFEKLVESGIFKDRSTVAYALCAYKNLRQPDSGPLLTKTGKYTWITLPNHLVKDCGVEPKKVMTALALLKEASE